MENHTLKSLTESIRAELASPVVDLQRIQEKNKLAIDHYSTANDKIQSSLIQAHELQSFYNQIQQSINKIEGYDTQLNHLEALVDELELYVVDIQKSIRPQ
ncbi:hypothetical protein BC833DRAFT_583385 [Globomyces pollinis-pini]|nr:hypothetical protein BC833DRAFT_583385 [Globomyces pollinis-pini]